MTSAGGAAPEPRPLWRFTPHVIIFCSSACIMVVELVAGRLTARHLGSSLYTWTSIIGVVLAGMSLGNYIGGRAADRWRPQALLGWLFLASSAACLSILVLNNVIADSPLGRQTAVEWHWNYPTTVVVWTLILFLLPALLLGTVSPVTAKMALLRGRAMGSTIGSVYAWGAIGSIVGTFAAGFWLIAMTGSRGVVISAALAMAILGVCLGPGRAFHAVWVAALAGALWLSQTAWTPAFEFACQWGLQDGVSVGSGDARRFVRYRFVRDSNYQFVRVYDCGGDSGLSTGREISLDSLRHGYVDLADPSHLEYEYEQMYGSLAQRVLGHKGAIDAFFIGGGGYTFPRWVQNRWPGSRCDVAEIDPVVLEACHVAMGLPRDTTIRTFLNDARIVVAQMPAERKYDLIIGDAFSDVAVPWHLTTLEFHRSLKTHLSDGGLLLTNVIEDYHKGGFFLGSYIHTVKQVFRHVYVFCTGREGVCLGQDNFVVLATDSDDPELDRYLRSLGAWHGTDFAGSRLSDEQVADLTARGGWRVLTDDFAPVENLLAPMTR